MAVFFFEPGLMGLGLRQAQPPDGPRFGHEPGLPSTIIERSRDAARATGLEDRPRFGHEPGLMGYEDGPRFGNEPGLMGLGLRQAQPPDGPRL